MPLGFKDISGLTHNQANDGLPIGSIPGDSAGPVSVVVLTAFGEGLPPSDPLITITLYPNGAAIGHGTDGSGNISVQDTLVNQGDDITWASVASGGNITLPDGIWAQLIRGYVNNLNGTRGFGIQFLSYNVADFDPTLTDPPDSLVDSDISFDPNTNDGNVTLSWSYDNSAVENPDSFAIVRDGAFVASVPWVNGVLNYSYIDYLTVGGSGDYTYEIKAYKYGTPNVISPSSNSVVVSFSGVIPDINITGSGGIDLGGAATMVFITDPSGIYTLIPDQHYDRLYQRTTATYLDVAIPMPFAKSSFIGD